MPWRISDKAVNLLACLSVLFMGGTVVGLVLLGTQYDDGNVSGRLAAMDPGKDFETIQGGCTIRSSRWTLHSYYYSQPNCYSQCYHASACSERWTHNITLPGGNVTQSAPEDHLLSSLKSCANLDTDLPATPTVPSAFAANTTVPCWRAVQPSTITRNERLPDDPRTATYDGLNACRARCSLVVGYACGNEACVTIKDPAEQYSYYEKYDNPTMARNVGIVVGCSVGTLLTCVAGYWANKEYNKNVEVGSGCGSSGCGSSGRSCSCDGEEWQEGEEGQE
ncbi:hypothetical protein TrCOL_g4410 [Triparma columacea]|uniref:Uncharacterized protein n=1 Tax=Triparma columacea TaxID=722753 RepID=A0A9W7G8C3_9STRA|nr:hypothetical protein TrCOL_g4410 [Triparma columacea]